MARGAWVPWEATCSDLDHSFRARTDPIRPEPESRQRGAWSGSLALGIVRADQLAQARLQPFELGCGGRLVAGVSLAARAGGREASRERSGESAASRLGPAFRSDLIGVCMRSKWQSSCAHSDRKKRSRFCC